MTSRRQRRKREKEQRHAPKPVSPHDVELGGSVMRLVYSREQAAQALGVSLATLDRRVVPTIATVKTEWGARLIPAGELERYLAERTEEPRMPRRRTTHSGRRSTLADEVVARIRQERARGDSLAEVARRLNRDGIPTAQGGRQWWPSTVREVIARVTPHRPDGAPDSPARTRLLRAPRPRRGEPPTSQKPPALEPPPVTDDNAEVGSSRQGGQP
jgi:hypothetical protein